MEMKLKHVFVSAICALAVHHGISAKEAPPQESTVVLSGDDVTNDYLFDNFLSMITSEDYRLGAAAGLGFNIASERELRDFDKFRNKIRKVKDRFERATNRAWYRGHCLGGKSPMSKTRKEILQEMSNIESERTVITKSHLETTMKSLSEDDKVRVLNFLNNLRSGTSVTKVDSGEFYDKSPSRVIQSDIETGCVKHSGEYYSTEGESHE